MQRFNRLWQIVFLLVLAQTCWASQYQIEPNSKFRFPYSSKVTEIVKAVGPQNTSYLSIPIRKGQTLILQLAREDKNPSVAVELPGALRVENGDEYSFFDRSVVIIRTAASDGNATVRINNATAVQKDITFKYLVCETVEVADNKPVALDCRESVSLAHVKLNAGDARTIYVETPKRLQTTLSVLSAKMGSWTIDRLTEESKPIMVDFRANATDDYYFYLNGFDSKASLVSRPPSVEVGELSKPISGTIQTGEKKTYVFKARKGDILRCESNLPRTNYVALLHQPNAYITLSSRYANVMNISGYRRIESYYKASHPDIILVKEDMDIAASILSYDPSPMPYTLNVFPYGSSLKPGRKIEGVLAIGDSAIYKIEGVTGQRYCIEMSSKEFDSLLYICSNEQSQQAVNDDSGASLDSKMYFTVPKAGTYFIVATSQGGGGGGKYTISAKEEDAQKLAPNKIVYGDLRPSGSATYIVDVKQGQKIILYLKSKDCSITLYDQKGEKLDASIGIREANPYLIWYEPKESQTISLMIQAYEMMHYELKWILVD